MAEIKLNGCVKDRSRVDVVASFNANTPFSLSLLRSKNHTTIRGKLTVTYDTGASVTPNEDGLAKLVKGIGLQVNLGPKLCETVDLQQLVLYSQHLKRGRLKNDQPSTATGQTGLKGEVEFEFNLPLNREDPFDPTVSIPGQAPEISDIALVGTWGDSNDLGSGYTVTSAQLSVVDDIGWVCTEEGFKENFPPNERLMPNWYYGTQTFTGAVANLGQVLDLRPNVVIRAIFLIVKDDTGNRSDDVVSEFALKLYDNSYILGPMSFKDYQARMADDLDMDPLTGCIFIDCTKFDKQFCTPAGIQINKFGDIQLVYSTEGPGSVEWLFDAVLLRTGTI